MKKLSLMNLENQQLNERQLSEVKGGVSYLCECFLTDVEIDTGSVSGSKSTPPRPPQGGGTGGGKDAIDLPNP